MASNSPAGIPTQGEENGSNILVFDTENGHLNITHTGSTNSSYNDFHVSLGVSLIEDLLKMHEKFPMEDITETILPPTVAILTFYPDQQARYNIVKANMKAAGVKFIDNLDVLTVDAASGGEWDLGIVDCAFGPRADSLTMNRINVAITRFRDGLTLLMNMTQIAALPRNADSEPIKKLSNLLKTQPEKCQVVKQTSQSYVHSPWFPILVDYSNRFQTPLAQVEVGAMESASSGLASTLPPPTSSIDRTLEHYFLSGVTSGILIDNAGAAGLTSAAFAVIDSLYHQYSHKLEEQPTFTEMVLHYAVLGALNQSNAQNGPQTYIDRIQKTINVIMEKQNVFVHIFTVTSDGVVCVTPTAVPQGLKYIALFISSNAIKKEQAVDESSHFRGIKPDSTEAFVIPTPVEFRIV